MVREMSFRLHLHRGVVLSLLLVLGASIACSGDAKTPSQPVDHSAPFFSAPIPMGIGQTIGAPTFAAGDSTTGGHGQVIQGIACDGSTPVQHIHSHLTLIANGVQHAIPIAIGVLGAEEISNFVVDGRCFYWLHTHDATGIIHIEAPDSSQFTLGELFAIWGEPLSRSNVAGFQGDVVTYVDSTRYDGDLSALAFKERQQITLIVGAVPDTIPVYAIPSVF
jgi:hypothetical protein